MKKLLFITILFCSFFSTSYGQFDTEKLFGGANVAFAKPVGEFSDFAKGGFSYNIVLGYKLTENFGVGIEYGSAATASLSDSLSSGIFGIEIFGLNSYLAKGWYKFSEGTVRPYAALGLGLARFAEPDVTVGTDTVKGARRTGFGANMELGLNINNFNISYSFNINGKAPSEPVFSPGVKDLNVNYHRFALGYIYNF